MKLISTITILFLSLIGYAQMPDSKLPPLLFKGKITFERKLNLHKQIDAMMEGNSANSSFAEQMKKKIGKYKIDVFEMLFTTTESIYKPAKDGISESNMMFGNLPAERNMVYNNYENENFTAEKKIFEKTYLVHDSLKKIKWKLVDEYRKIAGFNCRRAETILMDSCYVIAFYTDAILAEGGPESFNGLPGMILGIVMPRLNITYFASKIENYIPNEKEIVPPSKGEKKTYLELEKTVKDNLKQWGKWVDKILWYAML